MWRPACRLPAAVCPQSGADLACPDYPSGRPGLPWPACSRSPSATSAEPADNDPWIESRLPEIVGLYEHLHRHPELSYREVHTAQRIAEELGVAGCDVTTGVGALGVVGVMKNGRGPTVLVRAELDALPVTEETGLPYASTVTDVDDQENSTGVMHACGHDVHMANLVGSGVLARVTTGIAGAGPSS